MQSGLYPNDKSGFAHTLRKIDHWLNMTLLRIAQCCIVLLVILVVFCVVVRYFNIRINVNWAEEIPALLVGLFAFLACTMGVRDHLHVSVSILYNKLRVGGKARRMLEIFTDLCVLIVAVIFVIDGGQLALTQYQRGTLMMATGWPRWVQYIGIPVAGLVMAFDSILFLTGVLKQNDTIFSDIVEDPIEYARMLRQQEALEKQTKDNAAVAATSEPQTYDNDSQEVKP